MLSALIDSLRREPYVAYAVARRLAPVLHLRRPDSWALFDYVSVRHALHDSATFSSRAAPPGGTPLDWLMFLDAPRHTQLRALVARAFTPHAVAALEPQVEALVHQLLDAALARGRMDVVADFADPLPVRVVMMLFGLPHDDAPRVVRWRDAILGLGHSLLGGERAARAVADYRAARDEMRPYVEALLVERRARPRDDLATTLAQATVDGAPLSDDEALGFFQLLVLAGTETTSGLITNTVLCLLDHPAEHARLRAGPELLPAALEEVLRFRTPVQVAFRVARADVVLHGRTIPAGALLLLMIGSANRDPRHFRDAHRFDPRRFAASRAPAAHVAFGHGAHFCLGAALARLEARVALAALLARGGTLRRATGDGWLPRAGLNVHGPRSLPVLLGTDPR